MVGSKTGFRSLTSLLLFLIAGFLWAQTPDYHNERLARKDGLSHPTVYGIAQDKRGFIWIGTQNGINRYDGYRMRTYAPDPGNQEISAHSSVSTMLTDKRGRIWMGTWGGGLAVLHPNSETFEHFRRQQGDPTSLGNNFVQAMAIDRDEHLWVGTNGGGLFQLNPETGHFRKVPLEFLVQEPRVWSVVCEKNGRIWAGTSNGLFSSSAGDREQKHYLHDPDDPATIPDMEVRCMIIDAWDRLWVGTRDGLAVYDPQKDAFIRVVEESEKDAANLPGTVVNTFYEDKPGVIMIGTLNGLVRIEESLDVMRTGRIRTRNLLPNVEVRSIYTDRSGVIWIGSRNEGVYKVKSAPFKHYHHNPKKHESLASDFVSCIYQDRQDRIWIGTRAGLELWDRENERFLHWKHDPAKPGSLSNNSIRAILQDHRGALWVGSYNGGLDLFDVDEGHFTNYRFDPRNEHSLSDNDVLILYEDAQRNLWVGTRIGLNLFRPQTNDFFRYLADPGDPQSLVNNDIRDMKEDRSGRFWLATKGGLALMNRQTGRFERFTADLGEPGRLSNNETRCIHEDWAGRLWIGTDMGLNLYREGGHFEVYTEENGFAGNLMFSVLDDGRHLWVSTGNGISRFNPDSGSVRNFDVGHGLQSNQFLPDSALLTSDGEMLFGGINGFNVFLPGKIIDNNTPPPVVFSGFRSLITGGEYQNIATGNSVEMSFENAVFAIDFAALDFRDPTQNKFAYRLDDQEAWTYLDNRRSVNFSKLPPGDYVLQVKAANADGFWNEDGARLQISVLPPFYRTIWAYGAYALTALLLLWYYNKRQQHRFLQERRAAERERMATRRLRQLDKMKDQFLANTSHELRTPLNGIIGIAESLIDGAGGPLEDKLSKNLGMIASSGRRLAGLVNDILDFSVLEKRELALELRPVDLFFQVEAVLALATTLAAEKDLRLENRVPRDLPSVLADENRLHQILINLVGNGIKFTEQGKVVISAEPEGDLVTIHVSDTGIGILPEHQHRIFDSFQQADGHTARIYGGTGLGLSISSKLAELHGGRLSVVSAPGEGSTFSFSLPISGEDVEPGAPLTMSQMTPAMEEEPEDLDPPVTITPKEASLTVSSDENPLVLIVDDDAVNRRVLLNILENEPYRALEAEDGETALELLRENASIKLVLLDLMLPGMSGYQVCRELRKTLTLRCLPIIFLTARNRVSDMVKAFRAGANDYLGKPVSKPELMARLETHLELAELNRELEQKVNERTRDLEVRTAEVLRAREQLLLQEKMASLGTLTAGVAHEINNPTNFAHGSVQNLETDLEEFRQFLIEAAGDDADATVIRLLNERIDRLGTHAEIIQEGTRRIRDIVRDLHNFSRLDQSTIKCAELTENLQSTVNLVRSRYHDHVIFETRFHDKLEMECLPAELNQVFMNLIVNGCQSIMEKQQEGAPKPGLMLIETRKEPGEAVITFKDNGKGIPKDIMARIFEPFFTTKPLGSGTGLGLSISVGIVKKHGGHIEATTSPEGATFTIHLPTETEIVQEFSRGIHGIVR